MATLASMTVRLGIDTSQLRRGAARAVDVVDDLAEGVAGLGVGLPAVAAVTAGVGGMAAAFASAGAAVGAFRLAVAPQMQAISDVSELAAAAEEAAAEGGKKAAEAQQAYTDALADLPGPTRAAAREFIGLQGDFQKWSDSLSATTMPVFTRGLEMVRGLLPALTPLVTAAANAFSGFLDDLGEGNGLERFATSLARVAEQNLSGLLASVKNVAVGVAGIVRAVLPFSGQMTGGIEAATAAFADWGQSLQGSQGFAEFIALARQGAQTLGTLAVAAGSLLVALGPLIGVTSQVALALAEVINAMPPEALTALATAITVTVVAWKAYRAASNAASVASDLLDSRLGQQIRTWLKLRAQAVGAMLRTAATATATAARTAAVWAMAALRMTATWLATMIRVAAATAARFAMMAARAVAWAAVMAAQWLIAMGPIGWVTAAVIGLAALIIANWDKIKKWTRAAWDWVWGKIKAIAGAIWQFFLNWTIYGRVIKHWDAIKAGTQRVWSSVVSWVKGIPDRILGALGNLGSLLYNAGMDVVRGLWNGIKAMGSWLRDTLVGWAKDIIPGPIADALGIASPSKVTEAQGRWIARGLIEGLTGSTRQVRAAAYRLSDIVRDSLDPGRRHSRALERISSGSGQLLRLANQETTVAARMKVANKRLTDLIKARARLAADVRKGILDSADITQFTGEPGSASTPAAILSGLRDRLAMAQKFAADLAALRKKGFRSDLIAQIAQAGVEQGSQAAAALASADKGMVSQINATQANLARAADRAGSVAGNAMHGAGVRAAEGIVKGLRSQQGAIEKQMLDIAKGMQRSIRRALGIRSPSTLMADQVGRWIPLGIAAGAEDAAPAMNKALAGLVEVPTPRVPGLAGIQAAQPVVVLEFTGPRELLKVIDKASRNRGGSTAGVLRRGQKRA